MALTPKLEIKQSQSLLMTPQLRQAINLLQLTNLELSELVEQELNNNPLLEREEDRLNEAQDDTALPTIDDYPSDNISETIENEEFLPDVDYDNEFPDDFGSDREGYEVEAGYDWADYNQSKNPLSADDAFDYFEQKLADSPSLFQLLEQQISGRFASPADQKLARILCDSLDGAGYFRGDLTDIAARLGVDKQRLIPLLQKMKTFEPSGIFAENLSECLKIQLQDLNRCDPAIACLLDNLDLLACRNFKELKKVCNISDEDLASMIADIKSLNPKPAAAYSVDNPDYIIPDVFVRRHKDGSFHLELNSLSLPRLLINHRYYAELLKTANGAKQAKRYLKENLSSANFLIRAMHQRATTILRVSEEIVRLQRDFFEHGIEQLRPLSLKDIAYNLEMHESTVSRVTTRKYMQTPRGLFELKFFFSQAAGTYNGDEETSTLTIKHKIKNLINEESPSNILSDDKIVELLAAQSIKIARRTVAKYRESMNIPTSAERKRLKRQPS